MRVWEAGERVTGSGRLRPPPLLYPLFHQELFNIDNR